MMMCATVEVIIKSDRDCNELLLFVFVFSCSRNECKLRSKREVCGNNSSEYGFELRQMFIFTKVILKTAYGIFVSKQWASWIILGVLVCNFRVFIWLTEVGRNKVLLAIARSRFLINKVEKFHRSCVEINIGW